MHVSTSRLNMRERPSPWIRREGEERGERREEGKEREYKIEGIVWT
jgi:hypothetical protein